MTQTQARIVARDLSDHTGTTVVAVSEDVWFGRWSGTSQTWGVVIDHAFYAETEHLPEPLQAALATKEDPS